MKKVLIDILDEAVEFSSFAAALGFAISVVGGGGALISAGIWLTEGQALAPLLTCSGLFLGGIVLLSLSPFFKLIKAFLENTVEQEQQLQQQVQQLQQDQQQQQLQQQLQQLQAQNQQLQQQLYHMQHQLQHQHQQQHQHQHQHQQQAQQINLRKEESPFTSPFHRL